MATNERLPRKVEQKRDVRLQIFITEQQDSKLTDLADIMGMTKNELARYAIANLSVGYSMAVDVLKEKLESEGKLHDSKSNKAIR